MSRKAFTLRAHPVMRGDEMRNRALEDTTLTLFFTGGVSLKTWAEVGNLDREVEMYKRLSGSLKRVNFISYGGSRDEVFSSQVGDIKILPVGWHRSQRLTIFDLLVRHFREIQDTDVLKTNQIPGSDIAIWLKRRFKKKLIVRCGYLYSHVIRNQSRDEKMINAAIELEKKAFSAADIGVVTSSWQRDTVVSQYDIDPVKIRVIPNYVMTDVFQPQPEVEKQYDLVFVGRAGKEKNLGNLLQALHSLKTKGNRIRLLMVGGCSYDSEIKETIERYSLDVTFAGNVPNFDLPPMLNQARVYILPSYYEGHPKTLLEAMSCGLPCIGSDVTGIEEDIEHTKTGYLCGTDYESIANAIETVLSDESLQETMGKNAQEYVQRNYSIDKVLEMELDAICEVVAQ